MYNANRAAGIRDPVTLSEDGGHTGLFKERATFLPNKGGEYAGAMYLATANDTIPRLPFMSIEELTTLEKLNEAFYQCSRIAHWKESTQRYKANLLIRNIELQDDIRSGRYKLSPTVKFDLVERGKKRHIEAPAIRDRIIQKILCQNILVPALSKPLIYDNYASLKDRGTSFARKRIEILLKRYIRKHGTDGYILQIDIKRYFDNIDHEVLKKLVHKRVNETQEIMKLIDYIIDSSSGADKGLNLGSEAPQIFAIYYLSPIDSYAKTVRGMKYYGRYMDDIFVISESKEELKTLLEEIREQLAKLKLELNERKTHITKLKHGFTFMQIKYSISDGKVIKRPTHSKIVRERRRLKKYKKLFDKGTMNENDISNAYKSWRNGVIKDCNACRKTIRSMDKVYDGLFPKEEGTLKQNREQVIQHAYRKEQLWQKQKKEQDQAM